MKLKRIHWLALAGLLLVALGAVYASQTRQVTVLADGRVQQASTRALIVSAALAELGIQLHSEDAVVPARWLPLQDGMVIAVQRAARVQVYADGQRYTVTTGEQDPLVVLNDLGIELGPQDSLLLAGQPLPEGSPLPAAAVLVLEVRRPYAVTLRVDGQTQQFTSAASTLGEALAENGIELNNADRLTPAPETQLDGALSATLVRARPLTIALGERSLSLHSAASTVGEALAQAGIALVGEDYSQPAEDQPVPEDGSIRVVRVIETVQLVQDVIRHETQWQPDDSADLDTISVVQLGQDGVLASRVRVRYEDGVEVDRQTEAERVLVEPLTQINGYGTNIVIRTAVVDGVTIEYYRAVQVFATSYSPCRSGVPNQCFHGTSHGLGSPRRGIIATWYNWYIALGGHTVYVPGYGSGVIADVGAYRDRSVPWIDLAYTDADYVPWASYVTLYFTTPVPPDVPMVWPP
ncbi:MAG: DUF348 domain-containing protein [Anaerolineales bacterium]|nr:MAG: DUF348 domain-containing protein [Anaerolineales bacterium]